MTARIQLLFLPGHSATAPPQSPRVRDEVQAEVPRQSEDADGTSRQKDCAHFRSACNSLRSA